MISSPVRCSAVCLANWACGNTSSSNGHTLVVTSDKDGANSVLDRELPDAEIVISQPFWPAYFYCVINAIGLQVVVASTDSMDIARGILRARR